MTCLRSRAHGLLLIATAFLLVAVPVRGEDWNQSVCPLLLHEEQLELQEAVLQVELARSSFAAFEEVFQMITSLWEAEATDRMRYLRGRYDRDAAKLALERADLLLRQQEALIEHLRLACGVETSGRDREQAAAMKQAYLRYRRADCDQQAKAIEVAETNLEFNRQWLASILELREQVSTRQDVILAELDLKHEEQRRDDARRRTQSCRAELAELEDSPRASP